MQGIRFCPNLLNSGFLQQQGRSHHCFTKCRMCQNIQELTPNSQKSEYEQHFMITEYQSKCIFSSKPTEQKWYPNKISCGNKTKHNSQSKPAAACNFRRKAILMTENLFL
ncbi:hypothetical protein PAMP_000827 [Pampus punctatissimus]